MSGESGPLHATLNKSMDNAVKSANSIPVTVAVPVRNEEVGLAACLERLGRFAEVVVLDSNSTDRTIEIAAGFGAKIINFAWNGRYPKKRNWMLINHPPSQPWVLFLDADEIVNDAFCDALAAELPGSSHSGYWLRYDNRFLGRPLRFGIPQRKLALFRVGLGIYERIEQQPGWSCLDMEIHEHPIVRGSVGEIRAALEHRDDRGLACFLGRHIEYAKWEANRLLALEAEVTAWSCLTRRQRFKYKNLRKWWFPLLYFGAAYIAKCGFLDGRAGLEYSLHKAWYFRTIRHLVREIEEQGNAADSS